MKRFMDDFLREIYVKVYRSWILGQKSEQYNIKEVDEKTIVLDGVGAIGKVVFQGNVIELSVTNKKNDHIIVSYSKFCILILF